MKQMTRDHIAIRIASLYRKCKTYGLEPIEVHLTEQDINDYLDHLNQYINGLNEFANEQIELRTIDSLLNESYYIDAIFKLSNEDSMYMVGINSQNKKVKVLENE